ncbi:MAG: hypothetical protein L0K86_15140 [Actinomycetia bacterium]|nr:hypothetical protein [Actinomycetes bacterium]
MGMQLRLRELYARDETNTGWTEWGSDDMYVGAVAMELRGPEQKPIVHRISPFRVGTFDDGDRTTYNPPRLFDNYGFGPNVFPKNIAVTFVLAEVDEGGTLNGFFDDLYNQMEQQEQKMKADIAAGRGPTNKQEEESFWAEVLKVSIEIGNALYERWKGDEIFDPKVVSFSLDSDAHRWNGSKTSPIEEVAFRGHKGTYVLRYDLHMHFNQFGT